LKQSQKEYKKIVIKIGASLLCSDGKEVDSAFLTAIAAGICELAREKREVVLVSSGAIALGMSVLGLEARPKELSYLQAAAAIGQNELMNLYRSVFRERKLSCAQVLLTWEDFSDRKRYLNAKNTLLALFRLGSIPIINENDTVSTDEIKFGDNDRLSALVATLINADLLVILSDVDGLLDKDKRVIRVVPEINAQIKALACPTDKKVCIGGMITKIEAAKIAVDSGIHCLIANGRKKQIILDAVESPENSGTLFLPKKELLTARQRWLAFGTKPKGKIIVDDGAKLALLDKKSLLSVGVTGVEGDFECGDIISVMDYQKREIARGKVGVSSRHLDRIKGTRFDKEVIHRDNIVVL